MSAEWEKHVDKVAEKFREQVYKTAYQFYGSTSSSEVADVLAAVFATMVKSRDVPKVVNQIFTPEFLESHNQKPIKENP